MKTANNGKSWQSINNSKLDGLEKFDFIDSLRGWAVNSKGDILTTTDGGQEWAQLAKLDYSPEPFFGPVHSIHFVNEFDGWLVTPFAVWRTQDGGKTWVKLIPAVSTYGPKETIYSCAFINSQEGWLGADHGVIYATKDGGSSWQAKHIAPEKALFDQMEFTNDQTGWVRTSPFNFFYYTNDKGQTWQLQPFGSTAEYYTILTLKMITLTEGWAVGFGSLHSSSDTMGTNQESVGAILRTVDGGNSWQPIELKNKERFFNRVYFQNSIVGWVFGHKNIYVTEDGGVSWRVALNLSF